MVLLAPQVFFSGMSKALLPICAFAGYGGNVVRPKVEQAAPWFVRDFRELIEALPESG